MKRLSFIHENPEVFGILFQQGILVDGLTSVSLRRFLVESLGIPEEYLEKRIETIFVNSKAVDDPADTAVRDGDTIALSAALPGLLGATLKKGGKYSSMRSSISAKKGSDPGPAITGSVRLKLFNLLGAELGPLLLESGVRVEKEPFMHFIKGRPQSFFKGLKEVSADGIKTDIESLAGILSQARLIFVKVRQ